jgi:hypothetical protein
MSTSIRSVAPPRLILVAVALAWKDCHRDHFLRHPVGILQGREDFEVAVKRNCRVENRSRSSKITALYCGFKFGRAKLSAGEEGVVV